MLLKDIEFKAKAIITTGTGVPTAKLTDGEFLFDLAAGDDGVLHDTWIAILVAFKVEIPKDEFEKFTVGGLISYLNARIGS